MGRGTSKAGGVATGDGGALTKAQLEGNEPLTQAQMDALDGDKPLADTIRETMPEAIKQYPGLIFPIEEKDRKELCIDGADSGTGYYKGSVKGVLADNNGRLSHGGKTGNYKKGFDINSVRAEVFENAKYNNVCVNMDYPKMKGTEKQINYAKNLIRGGIARDVNHFYVRKTPRVQSSHETAELHKEQLKQAETKYNRKFNSYSDYVNHVITNGKGWTMDRIKGVENAGDIIDIMNKYKKEKW